MKKNFLRVFKRVASMHVNAASHCKPKLINNVAQNIVTCKNKISYTSTTPACAHKKGQ